MHKAKHPHGIWSIWLIVACCSLSCLAESIRSDVGEISVACPDGWARIPSRTGLFAAVFQNPKECQIGSLHFHDSFTISIRPAGGADLAKFKTQLEQIAKQQAEVTNQKLRQLPKRAGVHYPDLQGVLTNSFKDIQVSGVPALLAKSVTVLVADDQPVISINNNILFVLNDKLYTVAAGYLKLREAEVSKMSEDFLASIRLKSESQ